VAFQEIADNWKSPPIAAWQVVNSGSCPPGYTKFPTFSWPGNDLSLEKSQRFA
jgi:hypothetical protein